MPTAPRDPDRAAAWASDCLDRERREAFIVCCAIVGLVPAWVAFDVLLEPELVRPFLALRLFATAFAAALMVALRRAPTAGVVRALTAAAFSVTGPCIAVMLPRVQHFNPYLFGFSLYFWTAGALLSWPLVWAAGVSTWLLATLAAAFLAWPGVRGPADLVAAGFYLGSAAVLASGMTFVHRRSVRRVFEVSFALERRNLELATTSRSLEVRNAELADALGRLRDAQARLVASEKLSALGRLLAGLSHEINNPVNVLHNNLAPVRAHVDGLLEIARLASSGAPDDAARARGRAAELDVGFVARDAVDAIDTMRAAVDRIRQIHRDLRAFIRGEAPERVHGDVNEGIRATVALVTRRVAPGIDVDLALEELPPVSFQPGQLNQVWHNLVQNALDAVGERGRVTVRSQRGADFVEVSIADDGPGIRPEHRACLFEPFFTTKPVGKGTGLGLATSYQIVARHGGTLSLDPAHPCGARFVVRLPVAAGAPA